MKNIASRNWGGARNTSDRVSRSLSLKQCIEIWDALHRAVELNMPITRFLTINWSLLGINARQGGQATSRLLKLASDWVRVRGYNWAWAYFREAGFKKTNRIESEVFTNNHVHIFYHVPDAIINGFKKQLRIWLKEIGGGKIKSKAYKTRSIGDNLTTYYRNHEYYIRQLEKEAFPYALKGGEKLAVQYFKNKYDISPKWIEAGGSIIGKRCGRSNNLKQVRGR